MDKELTPLDAFFEITIHPTSSSDGYFTVRDDLPDECNIVESALTRLEEKEHNCKVYLKQINGLASKLAKKEQALEIIKETCEFDFIKEQVNDNTTFEIHIRRKGKNHIYLSCLAIYPKSQEEFDLLKEVLCK